MRTKNALRNSLYNIFFQFIVLLIGFFVPKYIIEIYGSEVNGLTSNINQIINILNLLQAGLVGASIFELFTPISEKNYKKIGTIYYSSLRTFKRLSWFFLILIFISIPYLLLTLDTTLNVIEIISSVLILGINAFLIFRYVTSYDIIFTAHQKKHILVIGGIIEKTVYYLLLIVILASKVHYIYMYIAVLFGSIIKIIYLEYIFRKEYKSSIVKYKNENIYKVKNQTKLFKNQIVQNIIESTPILIVTTLYNLEYASILSIYLMVINLFKVFMTTLKNSVAPSFGDLAASKKQEKVINIFNIIQFIFTFFSLILYGTVALLITPFVKLYMINSETQYAFINLGICITLYICSYTQFLTYNMAIDSLGLYGEVSKGNMIVGVISILIMILLTYFNFELVYIGTTLFYTINIIHRYIILRKNNLELNSSNLISSFSPIVLIILLIVVAPIVLKKIILWKWWIVYAVVITLCLTIITIIYSLILHKIELKQLIEYIKESFKKRGIKK